MLIYKFFLFLLMNPFMAECHVKYESNAQDYPANLEMSGLNPFKIKSVRGGDTETPPKLRFMFEEDWEQSFGERSLEGQRKGLDSNYLTAQEMDLKSMFYYLSPTELENNQSVLLTIQNTSISNHSSTVASFLEKFPVQQWKAFGLFDETYLEKINEFWLGFDPATTTSHIIMGSLYTIMMTVGCSGNLLVIIMFLRVSSLRTPANYLVVNLALSDFVMLVKMPIFIINSFYEGPVLGAIGCQVYGFLGGLTGVASIMTLAAIAVDRYFVIVHPMSPYKRTTRSRALLMIGAVWCYSALFSSLPLFGINNYVSEGYLTSCSFDYLKSDFGSRLFIFIFFLAAWVVPLSCILYSYIAIFRAVVQAEKTDFFNSGTTRDSFKYNNKIEDRLRKDVKIAMLTTMIVAIWTVAWTPYAVVALLGIFGQKHLLSPFISTLPALFCKISSCINPFIYAINHPRFKKELTQDFNRIFHHVAMNTLLKCATNTSIAFDVTLSEENMSYQVRKQEDVPQNSNKFSSLNIIVHTHAPHATRRMDKTESEEETDFQNNCENINSGPSSRLTRTRSESNIVYQPEAGLDGNGKQTSCSSLKD